MISNKVKNHKESIRKVKNHKESIRKVKNHKEKNLLIKKEKPCNQAVARRLTVTIIITALAVIVSGISIYLRLERVNNMHIIIILVLGISAILVAFLILWTLGAHEKYVKLARVLRRCCLTGLAVGVSVFIVLQGLIISSAHTEEAEVDALIVLGAGLRNDAPSMILRTRLNAAIRYLESRGDTPIIVSGGLGEGATITEAEAMYQYLSARGVDESLIWKEEESTSTRENLAYSLAVMEENGLDVENAKIAIVSNEFHLYRAKLIAGKAGVEAVGVAAATPGLDLRVLYFFREALALANEVLL